MSIFFCWKGEMLTMQAQYVAQWVQLTPARPRRTVARCNMPRTQDWRRQIRHGSTSLCHGGTVRVFSIDHQVPETVGENVVSGTQDLLCTTGDA